MVERGVNVMMSFVVIVCVCAPVDTIRGYIITVCVCRVSRAI